MRVGGLESREAHNLAQAGASPAPATITKEAIKSLFCVRMSLMKFLDVGAAVILREGKILLAQRNRNKFLGGKWEFPGGKIEEGESVKVGLAREILEEFGIEVVVGKLLTSVAHEYKSVININLHAFFCQPKNIDFKISEHENVAWVVPAELLNYDLAPADLKIAKALLKNL